ncbi:NAD(P)H-dependent flavin oxidoreductase [Liberiplasma polymorphum]|jgi:nitronate monooxygenase|uniref:NAD(P)H-dependent flavin oxidoreductase n=1 Tax=Liberiplasma polymorphum TaxID=3374570 RepID=UPI003771BDED
MTITNMKALTIGHLQAKLPIVQGGMGVGISMANLASSVANEGGIGVISAAGNGMFEKVKGKTFMENNIDAFVSEIRKAKSLTKGILGVNIMVAMTQFKDMVVAAISEKIDIIFAGAGLPLDLPKYITEGVKTKIVPIISSARAARIITQKWLQQYDYLPDAFVIEGPKAGGHLGFKETQLEDPNFQLDKILVEVKDILKPFEEAHQQKIPLIVAGGIYTGDDIYEFLNIGADGVQMATRFVTTHECDADIKFKETYINAKKEDITIISSPVGLPGRAISNEYLDQVALGNKHPFSCPFDCIHSCKREEAPYCISLALYNAKKGKLTHGFAFAGVNAYRAEAIISVKELIQELKNDFAKKATLQFN